MIIRGIISNLDHNEYYSGHNSEQYSRDFIDRTLRNVNVGGTVTFKPHNSKSILLKITLL